MSTLEQKQTSNTLEENRGVKHIALETESKFTKTQGILETQIETSTLSPEAKKSYQERGAALLQKYSTHARKLVQIAAVAAAINAAPAFAQTQDTETLEQPTVATQTVETGDTSQEDTTNRELPQTTSQEAFQLSEKAESEFGKEPEQIGQIELDPATTSSIIVSALESATKDKLTDIKENPVRTGAGLVSMFAKGPLKHVADIMDVAKSIQKSAQEKRSPKETAEAVGRLLLNIKTLGLGGLVLDFLKAQTPPDKESSQE